MIAHTHFLSKKAESIMPDSSRKKIMLVDDNMTNLALGKSMLKEHYEVYALPSTEKLMMSLERVIPDLILLDVEMPDMDGYETISLLKADERYMDIPVIFVTVRSENADELEGLELGAADYITKPFSAPLLLKRIENHLQSRQQKNDLRIYNENLMDMVKDRTSQIFEMQSAIISTVAELVEFRDDATGGHVTRTKKYVQILIERMLADGVYTYEVMAWNMDFLLPSVALHDVGKIAIDDAILNKPGKLTDAEFEIMKTHVVKGVEAIEKMMANLSEVGFLSHAKSVAWTHHEKWDGSGYPRGLKGTDIPLEGRVMAIADVYDALVSKRSYKAAFDPDSAAAIIARGAGTHFDPILVEVFQSVQDSFCKVLE